MKRSLAGLGCALLLNLASTAQEKPEYSAALIPDSLKTNASCVIRKLEVEMKIGKPGTATIKTLRVITALNESGTEDLDFWDYADDFRKLSEAEVRVYDAAGNLLKKYRKKEMEKLGTADENTIVQAGKYYRLRMPNFPVPFTVESYTEVSLSGFIDISDFYTRYMETSIQYSSFSITAPPSNPVRYKNIRTNIQPVITQKDMTTWQWQVHNATAMLPEKGSPAGNLPRILISPSFFEMDNYPGEITNWQTYGNWYNKLSYGSNNLPEEKFTFFRDMVKDIPDTLLKIKKLYRYLQQNHRYVSIQLGIGGFKPFNAAYVDKNKFGDCKALSNFMQTILGAVGIRSHQALINAGYNQTPVDAEFANESFDHVILCVPMRKDSVWLECTSRDAPFGQLGNFTENRYALLVTENGGRLVATPVSRAPDNVFSSSSTVMLEADGSGKAIAHITHKGSMHETVRDGLWERPEHNQREFLIRGQGFKDFDLMALSKEPGEENQGITHLDLHFEKIPDFSAGSKHFLRPHLYMLWDYELPEQKTKRVNDFIFRDPFIEESTTEWQLPEGYITESTPPSVSFGFGLGSFEARYTIDAANRKVTAFARLELKKNRIPAAQYTEAQEFFQRVVKELAQKVIVKRG